VRNKDSWRPFLLLGLALLVGLAALIAVIYQSSYLEAELLALEVRIQTLQHEIQETGSEIEELEEAQGETPAIVEARVIRVIDGDTIEVNVEGVIHKVRYIGIDTPETVDPSEPVECFGKEASDKNSELVEGKIVRLEKDVSETDIYGRLLRYVWVGDIFVNDYLVRQGYAYAYTYPPDVKYAEQFAEAQREARENNRGLWAICE
jgi:endonuclease YncB( thermonuclease family)